jgi:N-acetylglucosaminyl-diphospho-decaprenol L-rhamnosyltransferase
MLSHFSARESDMIDLSVVIVNHNTCELLAACLASVRQSVGTAETEVFVVDNASTDGSADMVHASFPQAHLFALSENEGFARATNKGIAASSGRLVVLLNSDTLIIADALARLAQFMDVHPEYAVAGPQLLNSDGSVQTSGYLFTTVLDVLWETFMLDKAFPRNPLFNRRALGGRELRMTQDVEWVSAACLLARRETLERVGLLDEGFFMYDVEVDWCRRVKEAGLRIAYVPEVQVVHHGGAVLARMRGDVAGRLLASRLRYFGKHGGNGAVLAVRLIFALGMVLRLLVLPVHWLIRRPNVRSDARYYWRSLWAALGVGND